MSQSGYESDKTDKSMGVNPLSNLQTQQQQSRRVQNTRGGTSNSNGSQLGGSNLGGSNSIKSTPNC